MERSNKITDRAPAFLKNRPDHLRAAFNFILIFAGFFVFMTGCLSGDKMKAGLASLPDRSIPEEMLPWLEAGRQSEITPGILAEARHITGASRRERLFKAKQHLLACFTYDPHLNSIAFEKSAGDLFAGKVLGGCSDFALVEVTFYRAVGIPARLVLSANVDWMLQYPADPLVLPEGHCFVEVFLENRWYLVDPTFRWLFSVYDPESPHLPHGEYFFKRGKDFWDMGINDIRSFDQQLKSFCRRFQGDYTAPGYPKAPF